MGRMTREEMWQAMAQAVEARSTCSRNKVGAIIVRDGRPIMTGYNGAPAGMPHCDHTCTCDEDYPDYDHQPTRHRPTCPAKPGCTVAVHAEANAIAYAAREGMATQGTHIITTLSPCLPCAQLIISAGINTVTFTREYRDTAGLGLLYVHGTLVKKYGVPEWWSPR